MSDITGNAFITTKKGTCYLTIKIDGRNSNLMKIRQYQIEPDEKRQMRRLYPNVTFDWKKITTQLAEKREVCRSYRSRRRASARPRRTREPFYGVADPFTRTVYVNDPSNVAGVGALLDALMAQDRR
jgi:hypothetical protein